MQFLKTADRDGIYYDGKSEDVLLKKLQAGETVWPVVSPTWEEYYHLSPTRENVVNWIPLEGLSVLEVGAGCGAITGALANSAEHVTALELTEKRATINSFRHSNKKNISYVVGNLEEFVKIDSEKFDVVTCIGVLEYAGRYISSQDPFHGFIEMLKSRLNDDGTLIIAIENPLGIKYFSGVPEDHVGKFFESIHGYPRYSGIKTFSKKALAEMLQAAGFNDIRFFYPQPDYKFPSVIYSDDLLPGESFELSLKGLPVASNNIQRLNIFNEQSLTRTIAREGLFGEFSNSFIILASRESSSLEVPLFAKGPTSRKKEYEATTLVNRSGSGKLTFQKRHTSNESKKHVESMVRANKKLLKVVPKNLKIAMCTKHNKGVEFEFINGKTLQYGLLEAFINNDRDQAEKIAEKFSGLLKSFQTVKIDPTTNKEYTKVFGNLIKGEQTCLAIGLLDLNLDNIIQDDKDLYLIDYEWLYDFPIPTEFIHARSWFYFFNPHLETMKMLCSPDNPMVTITDGFWVPQWFYNKHLGDYDWKNVIDTEIRFQQEVLDRSTSINVYKEPVIISDEVPTFPEEYLKIKQKLERTQERIDHIKAEYEENQKQLQASVEELEQRIRDYKNPKKLTKKIIKKAVKKVKRTV